MASNLYESLSQQVNSLHATGAHSDQASSEYLNQSMDSRRPYPYQYPQTLHEERPLVLSEHWSRYSVSEFLGTLIATIAFDYTAYTLSGEQKEDYVLSSFLFLAFGVGAAYFLGLLIAVDANLNGMFTFALALRWVKPWRMVPIILLSQFIGATTAHLMFYFMIGSPEPLDEEVAFCFGITPPPDQVSNGRIVMSSIVLITILMMSLLPVFSPELGGDRNQSHFASSMIAALIITAVSIPGASAGAQLNPTTFFSAFMAMTLLGFDEKYYSVHDHYWWTALVAPIAGVVVAMIVLNLFNVVLWNEPKDWKMALKKMISPPSD